MGRKVWVPTVSGPLARCVRGGVCVVADVAGVFGLRHTKRVAIKSKGVASQRWRYGSREHPDHAHLRARRSRAQGASDRADRATRSQAQ